MHVVVLLLTFLMLWLSKPMPVAFAETATKRALEAVRVWPSDKKTRVVLEFNHAFDYKVFSLDNPERLVIDVQQADWQAKLMPGELSDTPINKIRHGQRKGGHLRVVLDLNSTIQRTDYVLKPSAHYGHRLVVDIKSKAQTQSQSGESLAARLKPTLAIPTKKSPAVSRKSTQPTKKAVTRTPKGLRNVVVAIDPGHGGTDPGALGKNGLQEKHVVLQIGRFLKEEIDRSPGMRAVLTRTGDYFVPLAKRRSIAREQHQADIFISIHADAWTEADARGASVYVLSRRGASSALARYLAKKDNAAHVKADAALGQQDSMLRNVLADLAMEGSLEHSFRVAEYALDELGGVTQLHKKSVEQAGFVVLKSLDIPSVLVETGFISNPGEEKQLANRRHQKKLARALFKAVRMYFKTLPPPGTYFAALQGQWPGQHTITAGETLSEIAIRYQTSTEQLKRLNKLNSDVIYVGRVLSLPPPVE